MSIHMEKIAFLPEPCRVLGVLLRELVDQFLQP
jgi:hypothetical protein